MIEHCPALPFTTSGGNLLFALPMPEKTHSRLPKPDQSPTDSGEEPKNIGKVYSNGIRVRIRPRKIRLPDVLFLHKDHFAVRHNRVWDGADLVMEVVSDAPKDRQRDYELKLLDYAEAKIAEYWIVDLEREVVIVHRLEGDHYRVQGEFTRGQEAISHLLSGFGVDVSALFAVAEDIPE